MVEGASATRKFTANFCLHQQVSTSVPRKFLRRNLRQILDSHERTVRRKANHASQEEMVANEKSPAGWDYPTHDMLKDLVHGEKPVLQLDSLHIRHPDSNPRKRKRHPPINRDEEPDWLPPPEATTRWSCQVSVAVRETQASKRSVYVDTRSGTIQGLQQDTDEHSSFELELTQPFVIDVDKLSVAVESGTNGARHWERTVIAKYSLEVSVQCRGSDDSAEFLSQLENQPKSRYDHIAGNEGVVRAAWEELPTCPRVDQILPLKRTSGHSVIRLEHGIELNMGWARKRDSPLQRYNQANCRMLTRSHQLLTPEFTEQATKHVITYKFCEGLSTRVRKVEGLACPVCKETPKSFPRLLLHCLTFHDHFKFEIEEEDKNLTVNASIVRKTLLFSPADRPPEVATGQRAVESSWVAPERPFNLQTHLAGDDNWPAFTRPEAPKRRGRRSAMPDKGSQSGSAAQPVLQRPAPSDVRDLLAKGNRRHIVPSVPGVRFYHSKSKKPIEPGEMISDSEEDVENLWLEERDRRELSELDLHGGSQDFLIAWNQYMSREQSGSKVLMNDAVVRFTRMHLVKFQDPGWQRTYRKMLEQLEAGGVLKSVTVAHCLHLVRPRDEDGDIQMIDGVHEEVHSGRTNGLSGRIDGLDKENQPAPGLGRPPSVDSPMLNGERKGKGRARWGTGGSSDPASTRPDRGTPNGTHPTNGDAKPVPNKDPKGLCPCGKSAKDARAALTCDNARCVRRFYHLACVGLQRRQQGWKCKDCAG